MILSELKTLLATMPGYTAATPLVDVRTQCREMMTAAQQWFKQMGWVR